MIEDFFIVVQFLQKINKKKFFLIYFVFIGTQTANHQITCIL